MEQYVGYSISEEILDEATYAKGYSSISISNKFNIILGYLSYLKDEVNNNSNRNIQELLTEAQTISVYNSPDAYKWLIEVQKTMDLYKDYYITTEILNEVTYSKGYSSTSISNKFNIIVGYLLYLNDKIQMGDMVITEDKIDSLIEEGKTITDWESSEAYKWLLNVEEFNQVYSYTSIYDSLVEHCNNAKGYSSISISNMNNLILADLIILKNELIKIRILDRIEICSMPRKTVYYEGDKFDSSGMSINVIYTCVHNDDSVSEQTNISTDFTVDTTTPLSCDDEEWSISYTEGEVTKTVKIQIIVKPVLISETLKSIEIATPPYKTVYKEGETFSKYGMKVDAIYDQQWSNGTESTVKKENVLFVVDTKTKLSASDTSVTVYVTDGDVSLSIEQAITVESYITGTVLDKIVVAKDPLKTTYVEGEKFDKSGMIINATYKSTWSNGYEEYIEKENITNYYVNTTSPLILGTDKITVTLIDGGIKKTVDIPIIVVAKENKITSLKLKTKKNRKIVISFNKVDGVSGYQIQYATNKKFSKGKKSITLKSSKKNSYTTGKLKKGKTYYVKVRTYKKDGKKKVYGKWSSVKKIKIKK